MDPVVQAALVAGGWTVVATLGTQWLAGRREAARDKSLAEREERNQRWDTNRERLIELRALLDTSGVTLMACERAVDDLHTAVVLREQLEVEITKAKVDRVASLDSELDEFEGRLSLRLGSTHQVTRAFTLACAALSDAYLRLHGAVVEFAQPDETNTSDDVEKRRSKRASSLEKAKGEARKYRRQFFEEARQLIGVQHPLDDLSPKPEKRTALR